MFAGVHWSCRVLHPLAQMEAARLGATHQGQPGLPHRLHPGDHLHNCGPHDNHPRGDSHRPGHYRHRCPGVFPLHRLEEQTCRSPETQRFRHFFTSETVCGGAAFQDRMKQREDRPSLLNINHPLLGVIVTGKESIIFSIIFDRI